MVRIKNLRVHDKAVFWTVERMDYTGRIYGTDYRTNNAGEGLFIDDGIENRQILGTAQFQLHQQTLSGMRKALLKHFTI